MLMPRRGFLSQQSICSIPDVCMYAYLFMKLHITALCVAIVCYGTRIGTPNGGSMIFVTKTVRVFV